MSATARISVKEAAQALNLSPATVRQLIADGGWACIGAHAVKHEGSTQTVYVIPRKPFERLISGELPVTIALHTHKHVNPDAIGQAVLTAVTAAIDAAS